jgi:hypothetical protein
VLDAYPAGVLLTFFRRRRRIPAKSTSNVAQLFSGRMNAKQYHQHFLNAVSAPATI